LKAEFDFLFDYSKQFNSVVDDSLKVSDPYSKFSND